MLLVVFVIPAAVIFHDFWNCLANDPMRGMQMANFMKNIGLAGGLLMVLAYGSGTWSLDAILPKCRKCATTAQQER